MYLIFKGFARDLPVFLGLNGWVLGKVAAVSGSVDLRSKYGIIWRYRFDASEYRGKAKKPL